MSVEEFDNEKRQEENQIKGQVTWLKVIDETMKEIKRFFVTSFNQLASSVKSHTYKVEVTNQKDVKFPDVQKVTITNPTSNKELADLLKEVSAKLVALDKEIKINIPDSVTVKNFPAQEKMPEFKFPKEMVVSNMGAIVKEMKSIVKSMPKEIKLKQGFLDKTPKVTVNVDNKELLTRVEALQGAFERLADRRYPETDLQPLIEAVNKTTHSLDSLEFPVPTFNSESIVDAINNMTIEVGDVTINTQQVEDNQLSGEQKTQVVTSAGAVVDVFGTPDGATNETIEKLIGFDENDDLTSSVVTVGAVKTIITSNGTKTLTTVVDITDVNNIEISDTWS